MRPDRLTSAEGLDQPRVVEIAVDDHPACLAMVGNSRDHRKLLPRASNDISHRRISLGRVAATTHVDIDHRLLIAPVDLGIFFFGALLDLGIGLVEPPLNRNMRLFIGARNGLLWRESPTLEIFAHTAHRDANTTHSFAESIVPRLNKAGALWTQMQTIAN